MTDSNSNVLQFPESHLQVVPWPDPVLDQVGYDIRSTYVERFWLPVLGPSVLLVLRRFNADLQQEPDGFRINTTELALEFGLGMKGGRHGIP